MDNVGRRLEHILMWRGNWKSSLPKLESDREEGTVSNVDNATSIAPPLEGQRKADPLWSVLTHVLRYCDSNHDGHSKPADDKLEAMKNTCSDLEYIDDSIRSCG
ncbi:hypothetical protein FNV43_RR16930 [Rhamnella rubrinervis]|uniref:Uncharacterized protein n=1 Tax=Rhamnella rubrinervis TaxID=2594499 RepID=A0A8K0GZR7_9ROSA|nr:hypothetical protein FNV43_RR16930 [Rhamnella rubrinervis]